MPFNVTCVHVHEHCAQGSYMPISKVIFFRRNSFNQMPFLPNANSDSWVLQRYIPSHQSNSLLKCSYSYKIIMF